MTEKAFYDTYWPAISRDKKSLGDWLAKGIVQERGPITEMQSTQYINDTSNEKHNVELTSISKNIVVTTANNERKTLTISYNYDPKTKSSKVLVYDGYTQMRQKSVKGDQSIALQSFYELKNLEDAANNRTIDSDRFLEADEFASYSPIKNNGQVMTLRDQSHNYNEAELKAEFKNLPTQRIAKLLSMRLDTEIWRRNQDKDAKFNDGANAKFNDVADWKVGNSVLNLYISLDKNGRPILTDMKGTFVTPLHLSRQDEQTILKNCEMFDNYIMHKNKQQNNVVKKEEQTAKKEQVVTQPEVVTHPETATKQEIVTESKTPAYLQGNELNNKVEEADTQEISHAQWTADLSAHFNYLQQLDFEEKQALQLKEKTTKTRAKRTRNLQQAVELGDTEQLPPQQTPQTTETKQKQKTQTKVQNIAQ